MVTTGKHHNCALCHVATTLPIVQSTTSVEQAGPDFRWHCHAVAHWNLPPNPVDIDQPEGRMHRYHGHAIRKNVAQAVGAEAVEHARTRVWRGAHASPWGVGGYRFVDERFGRDGGLVPHMASRVVMGAGQRRRDRLTVWEGPVSAGPRMGLPGLRVRRRLHERHYEHPAALDAPAPGEDAKPAREQETPGVQMAALRVPRLDAASFTTISWPRPRGAAPLAQRVCRQLRPVVAAQV